MHWKFVEHKLIIFCHYLSANQTCPRHRHGSPLKCTWPVWLSCSGSLHSPPWLDRERTNNYLVNGIPGKWPIEICHLFILLKILPNENQRTVKRWKDNVNTWLSNLRIYLPFSHFTYSTGEVRQKDTVSSKLFTESLESMYIKLNWKT